MQKNGILSSISPDKHLWEFNVDHFKEEYFIFKKVGINKVYTFLGFCDKHDTDVFKKIENQIEINFNDYESCLLFALRTLCNELWLKLVVQKQHKCILDNENILVDANLIQKTIEQGEIAIEDLNFFKNSLWSDLKTNEESFVFNWRELPYNEICLNSIFTYETSSEIMAYIKTHGKDKERLTEIFISFFPYNGKSILMMGYHKADSQYAKPFVNMFFKENDKKVLRRLSNLIIFNCETWVCSNNFYQQKLQGLDSEFFKATIFSSENGNGRRVFDVNLFDENFRDKFKIFVKKNINSV